MLMSDQSCQEFLMSKNVLSVLVFINGYKTEIWHSLILLHPINLQV